MDVVFQVILLIEIQIPNQIQLNTYYYCCWCCQYNWHCPLTHVQCVDGNSQENTLNQSGVYNNHTWNDPEWIRSYSDFSSKFYATTTCASAELSVDYTTVYAYIYYEVQRQERHNANERKGINVFVLRMFVFFLSVSGHHTT